MRGRRMRTCWWCSTDNRMSIDPNVGALKEYLLNITTSKRYNQAKHHTWTRLERFPKLRRTIQKMGNALKGGFLQQSNLFESLNFRYFGPVDGHNVEQLTRVLKDLKEIPGPKPAARTDGEGQRVSAGRRASAHLARSGAVQSRNGRTARTIRETGPRRAIRMCSARRCSNWPGGMNGS